MKELEWYEVISSRTGIAHLRQGPELSSPDAGSLTAGEFCVVDDFHTLPTGQIRAHVCCGATQGWLSAKQLSKLDAAQTAAKEEAMLARIHTNRVKEDTAQQRVNCVSVSPWSDSKLVREDAEVKQLEEEIELLQQLEEIAHEEACLTQDSSVDVASLSFDEMDANKDGVLSREEFAVGREVSCTVLTLF